VGSVKEGTIYKGKSEVKRHLLSPHVKVDRSRLADENGYVASEWTGHLEVPIVLLEKIH